MNDPLIPLSISEIVYVALSVAQQSSNLDDRTKENIELILTSYRTKRDTYLTSRGISAEDISEITAAAAEAMANWLDDRALKADLADGIMDEFERDFSESQAQDRNQGATSRRREEVEGDDGDWGPDDIAPPGGGWDPGGGAADPGGQGNS
ncbi:hypothetical protein [Mycobacterium phage Azrael100]|uniref:Uncharacterized protein n=1 Tax=Mycobacterium phage Cosmo TaxID=1567467 RepID=A0A0B5A4Z3_9CAUD|nr:hypothetical protein COSMO_74 [Mycobacterium phage Cosmo]WKR36084.1 hypothetical protein [Mycobacterium phage Azrael100]